MKSLIVLAVASFITGSVSAASIPALRCLGTEPFWAVNTSAKGIVTYNSPGPEGKRSYPFSEMRDAAGTGPGYAFQISSHDGGKQTIKLNIVKAECNDGMSDNTYPYNVLVEINGELLYGCCE